MILLMKLLEKILETIGIAEVRKLLWTDPGNADFSAQTISLDLSGYDLVEIHFYESRINGRRFAMSQRFRIGVDAMMRNLNHPTNGSTASVLQRRLKATSTGVQFHDGQYRAITSSAAPNTGNDVFVPTAIYGIKKLGGGTS